MTDNVTLCNRIYSESFNVVPRQICRENFTTGQAKSWSQYNNEEECTQNGGKERGKGGRGREREREGEREGRERGKGRGKGGKGGRGREGEREGEREGREGGRGREGEREGRERGKGRGRYFEVGVNSLNRSASCVCYMSTV